MNLWPFFSLDLCLLCDQTSHRPVSFSLASQLLLTPISWTLMEGSFQRCAAFSPSKQTEFLTPYCWELEIPWPPDSLSFWEIPPFFVKVVSQMSHLPGPIRQMEMTDLSHSMNAFFSRSNSIRTSSLQEVISAPKNFLKMISHNTKTTNKWSE